MANNTGTAPVTEQASSGNLKIAIIGAGISGLTLAIALHRRNVPFTLYEATPEFKEIGAGVAFTPNAIQAMKICHDGIHEAFEKICTKNMWPSKAEVWFDYVDGRASSESQDPVFTIPSPIGQNGVHRAHFLDEMVRLLPEDVAKFHKRLVDIEHTDDNGELTIKFEDGTTATADLIIACDGIKSRARQIVVGEDHPSAHPTYTYKYAYRGLIPMEKAVKAIGEERAQNACMHVGHDAHLLTFPINHGKILNIVAFRTTTDDWEDFSHLTKKATREQLMHDFSAFNQQTKAILELTDPSLDIWAIFDTGKHPPPTYYRGRIGLAGDAAHATSPHHGAGAGFCIEDSAMLAELLADPRVSSKEHFETVLQIFDKHRRERCQWLVKSSAFTGECYELRAEGVGDNLQELESEINQRNGVIANADVAGMIEKAREDLHRVLS